MLPFYDANAKLRYIKFCLLFFTFLLVLTGIGLIVIGTTINAIYSEYSYFFQIDYLSPAVAVVFIGFTIFGTACIGLYGTLKQKPCAIIAYGVLLGGLCLLQLSVEIAGYLTTSMITDNLRIIMNSIMNNYPFDATSAEMMDKVQWNLCCCGMDSAKDWYHVYKNPEIPKSCCATDVDGVNCQYFFNRGCYGVLASIAQDTNQILSTSSNILCIMELLGMAFALYLASCLNRRNKAKMEKKRLVTEQLLHCEADALTA